MPTKRMKNLEAEREQLLKHMKEQIDPALLRRIEEQEHSTSQPLQMTVVVSHSGASDARTE
jgi:hypothetical protein